MRLSDLRTLEAGSTVAADVCIVGSGPAGLTLARELEGSGLKVVLVESGGTEPEAWTESLDAIVSVGATRVSVPGEVRTRALGGTSAAWGGRIAKLGDIDFQRREWVPGSGWPIMLAALEPYYSRAARHLNLTVADPNHVEIRRIVARSLPAPPDPALSAYLWSYSMNDSLAPDFLRFGPRAREWPLDDVRCLLHATVTHIDTDPEGRRVSRVELTTPDLIRHWVSARHVVLCAGGLENARLLLASNRTVPRGLGNESDLVGRYLMDHPRGQVARFPAGAQAQAGALLADFILSASRLAPAPLVPGSRRPTWLTPGYALGAEIQQREALLNCAVFLTPELAEDDPLAALLALAGGQDPRRNLGHLLSDLPFTAAALARLRQGRYPARRLSGLHAQCIVEQRPDRDSRIRLSDRLDALGVPLGLVDWRTSEQEARTVRRATQLFIAEMERLGLPAPEPLAMVADERVEFFLPDVAHPSGTTRMSADPAAGVVDADCAVHGMENLHILGGSVFPTNGHANPTYTIVALAVRLADRLKARLHGERVESSRVHSSPSERTAPGEGRRRVGISGAQGYVGGVIAAALSEAGHEVVGLSRRPGPRYAHRSYDLAAPVEPDLLVGIDTVIHCAYAWEPTDWDEIVRVNVDGSRRLVQASAAAGARFILISSVSAFTGTRQRYGNAKLLTEALTLEAGGTVLRLGTVYGGANGGLIGLLRRVAALPVIPVFAPRSPQALISVENLGAAVVELVDHPQPGAQLAGLASPVTVSFAELMRQVAASQGRRPRIFPLPWKPLYLLLRGIEGLGLRLPLSSETVLGLAETAPELAPTDLWQTLAVPLDPPRLRTG